MKEVKLLHSYGNRDINEYTWQKPEITDDEIEIKTALCGVCRSDIGGYVSWEKPMPLGMQGHEGLGIVTKIGKNVQDVKEGDYVATWGDPAYADYYNVGKDEFVVVPELHHKYILQPVACAVNILEKTLETATFLQKNGNFQVVLLGTGFMSMVIGQLMSPEKLLVVGNSNKEYWKSIGYTPYPSVKDLPNKEYKVVIDLTSKAENYPIITDLTSEEGLICYAATPFSPVSTNFFENCWKCHTIIMPSPRNSDFLEMMRLTAYYIKTGKLNTDILWTKGYDRHNLKEVKQAFEDGVNRTPEYIRGYIKW